MHHSLPDLAFSELWTDMERCVGELRNSSPPCADTRICSICCPRHHASIESTPVSSNTCIGNHCRCWNHGRMRRAARLIPFNTAHHIRQGHPRVHLSSTATGPAERTAPGLYVLQLLQKHGKYLISKVVTRMGPDEFTDPHSLIL